MFIWFLLRLLVEDKRRLRRMEGRDHRRSGSQSAGACWPVTAWVAGCSMAIPPGGWRTNSAFKDGICHSRCLVHQKRSCVPLAPWMASFRLRTVRFLPYTRLSWSENDPLPKADRNARGEAICGGEVNCHTMPRRTCIALSRSGQPDTQCHRSSRALARSSGTGTTSTLTAPATLISSDGKGGAPASFKLSRRY